MDIGDKIFTPKHIGTVVDFRGDNMLGINFDSRDGRERNYNEVTIRMVEDMIASKEWYVDNDTFA
jgi:hypothetical protein